jgi:DNA-binding HxlR family transcriptional regulator
MSDPNGAEIPPCGCILPGATDPAVCYCGVEDLLRIIRRRYSLAVLNAIHSRRSARFNEIAGALPQASTSTLAETLQALEAASLLDRRVEGDPSPYPTYTLTRSGVLLLDRLRRLLDEVQGS